MEKQNAILPNFPANHAFLRIIPTGILQTVFSTHHFITLSLNDHATIPS